MRVLSAELPDLAVDTMPTTSRDTALVRRHVTGVFRFVRSLGAPPELAADLTQEAFAIAWQKGKQGLPRKALAAWLRRSARLLWLQHHRSERRREAAIAAVSERRWQSIDDEDHGAERIEATKRCVGELRGRARQAVQLFYAEGKSREDVAKALDMQPNGVKTLLARTRRWLEQCIERSGT